MEHRFRNSEPPKLLFPLKVTMSSVTHAWYTEASLQTQLTVPLGHKPLLQVNLRGFLTITQYGVGIDPHA